jgi:hypothetical protein
MSYSERQKKVVMVKEPALSRKSPHPPWYKDQKGKGSNLVAVVFLSFFLLLFLSLQSTGGCG